MINDFAKIAKTFMCFIVLVIAIKAIVLPLLLKEQGGKNSEDGVPGSNTVTQVQSEDEPLKQRETEDDGRGVKYEVNLQRGIMP